MPTPFPEGSAYDDSSSWANHHYSMLLACGCTIGDAESVSAPALASIARGADGSSTAFKQALELGYISHASKLEGQAELDLLRGYTRTAGAKFLRASIIYELIDWVFWPWGSLDRSRAGEHHRKGRIAFKRGIALAGGAHAGATWTSVMFDGVPLEALFVPARSDNGAIAKGRSPVVLHLNGQHSSLQWQYSFGFPAALAERGISSFHVDHPGSGKARYDQGLGARPDDEVYAKVILNALEARDDVDGERIGLLGGSFGSYRAPRIASAEGRRIKATVAWSAQYDMSEDFVGLTERILAGGPFVEADRPILNQLFYWTGTSTTGELQQKWQGWTLKGRLENMTSAILCIRGDLDMMSASMAEATVGEAINSSRRELVTTDAAVGGRRHCHWDDPAYARGYIVDFLSEILGGHCS